MTLQDKQVRILMTQLAKGKTLKAAAAAAGIDPKSARKYRDSECLPSQADKSPRSYRTREDPFEEDWLEIEKKLTAAPELEAKILFEDLCERRPGVYQEGQLRSMQRRIKQWRASCGPAKEIFFEQDHRPGEAIQTDFTWCDELEITIAGQPFSHMLCHSVLPYSNWESVSTCQSESMAALRKGVQASLKALGFVPKIHQTDNSTAATHSIGTGLRHFNDDYLALMKHYEMEPRTIKVGKKEQNGDVESSHRAIKASIRQHLLLRRSRDFSSVAAYEAFLQNIVEKRNRLRTKRLREEQQCMRPLTVGPLPEFKELRTKVSRSSTIRVQENTYSVPSRLKNEVLLVKLYENRLEVYYSGKLQFCVERLLGANKHRINYRHIIESLLRKPGAFERYRYKADLFPTLVFRQAFDELVSVHGDFRGTVQYLQILKLAATTMECEVEAALSILISEKITLSSDRVKDLIDRVAKAPELEVRQPDLNCYDALYKDKAGLGEVA